MWEIPLFKIYWDEDDVEGVSSVIKRGSQWANGPEIQNFENNISKYIGSKHAVAFNSGTSAMHSLLMAYGIGPGDEVIVPSFTFISTANAPLFVGAKPVFAEIESTTLGLDPEDVNERITNKTKAIIPIHFGGCPCLIKELKEIAEDKNLLLIEDAAESLGAKINNSMVGTFGESAMLSFCQNKIISTGEGGAIVINSNKIFERLKLIRSHGRLETGDYFSSIEQMQYISLGYNFRISSISAALGSSQLKKIDNIIKMRREIAECMITGLSKIREISPPIAPKDFFHIYQMFTIQLEDSKDKILRNKLMNYLSDKSIMTKIYFYPVHLTEFYKKNFGYTEGCLPITEDLSNRVLSLPIYPTLKESEINYIINAIKEFFEESL